MLRIVHKSKKWQCGQNLLTWRYRQFLLKFFSCFSFQFQLLVKVSCQYYCWFWSYEIVFDIGLTRNHHTLIQVLPKILRLGWVRDIKFGTNVCNKMFLNAAKCQSYHFYNFYHFWVIKWNQQPEGVKISTPTPPIQIRVTFVKKGNLLGFYMDNNIIEGLWNFSCFIKSAFCFSFCKFYFSITWKT